ncbi:unnamed protein product [Cuscuta campestris]|uniref:Putative plant transposon protein domain-containing protein n=1 Tax=Cuscuta campestris TaxID=132261 RepID=A0A484MSV4_9ASTE|nr:unnamed protein product [Cuscuta campestris]
MAPKPVKKAKKVTTGRKKRNEDGSSSSQPPRLTSRDNETWWEERKETSFIIEKTIDPTIDNYFKLSNAFATLGWENMLTLTGTYFPELVREFYANITEKSKKRFLVRSYVRGTEVEIDLTYLREFLDLRDPSHPIHYMINRKGVVVDDRGYNIEETKGKFGVRDMLTRSFGLRWIRARLLIYLIGFNIVPRASGLNEIRNSDLYLVDRLIFGLPRIQKIALAPIIIKCIREVVASSRRDKNFVFPVLLSRIFIAQGVNTEGAEQRSTTQSDVFDHNKMSTLRYQFIDGA